MEKIVKILCVCAVLLVGWLDSRVTEAEAEGPGGKAGAILREAGHVGNFLVDKARMAWFDLKYGQLPDAVHLYQVSGALVSTAGQEYGSNVSICTNYFITTESRAFDFGNFLQERFQALFGKPSCSLPLALVMAEQSADMACTVQIGNASSTRKAKIVPDFPGGGPYCEKDVSGRLHNNECAVNRALKEYSAAMKMMPLIEQPSKEGWPDLASDIHSDSNGFPTVESLDWPPQTTSQFPSDYEALLSLDFQSPNVEVSAPPCSGALGPAQLPRQGRRRQEELFVR